MHRCIKAAQVSIRYHSRTEILNTLILKGNLRAGESLLHWKNFPFHPFSLSLWLGLSVSLSLYVFSNTALICFDQPGKMIKGLLSVLLVLVVVTSTMGKPEKGSDKAPVKKEKRIPQTLSRGECGQLLHYNTLLRIHSVLYGCFCLVVFVRCSSNYLNSNSENARRLFVTLLVVLLRMGGSTDLGSDLRRGALLGTLAVRNVRFAWSVSI